MDDTERYRIAAVSTRGEPIAPPEVRAKFVKACGVIVRDHIPITVREWLKPKEEGISYVGKKAKETLWEKLMVHFTLPTLEPDSDEEEPTEEEMNRRQKDLEAKVKEWALHKMADLFRGWKKRLNVEFVREDKTPDFNNGYEKVKDYWAEFVAYKKSEDALKKSSTNRENASKKKFNHRLGPSGYAGNEAKIAALEAPFLAKNIIPEPLEWIPRARNWFYAHDGTLDALGKAIMNQKHIDHPLGKEQPMIPIDKIRSAHEDVKKGRFIPDRENDELARALGKEQPGRSRGLTGSPPWMIAFSEERKRFPDRSHLRRKEREAAEKAADEAEKAAKDERLRTIEEAVKQLQQEISQQGGCQRLMIDAASKPKSSVASSHLHGHNDGNDDALVTSDPPRYPVDHITESTQCELKVVLANLRLTVALGMALPIGPKPTYHCSPVPNGYAVVAVDEVGKDYEELKLHYPAGEDKDLTELGEAKK